MSGKTLEKIKQLTKVRTEKVIVGSDGEKYDYVLTARDVAKAQGKSLNAVYTSRKGDCKLDKLTAFELIKKEIEKEEK